MPQEGKPLMKSTPNQPQSIHLNISVILHLVVNRGVPTHSISKMPFNPLQKHISVNTPVAVESVLPAEHVIVFSVWVNGTNKDLW